MDKISPLDKEFDRLLVRIRAYSGDFDISKLKEAWEFAKLAHAGQKRKSGDPYVLHALATAKILAEWKLDATSIIAGFLHDTIEDGGAKQADLKNDFGEEVALLVQGVTKVSTFKLRGSKEEQFVENLRKIILVMAKDLRVVMIKLADRLHNMRTLEFLPKDKQRRIARETLEVYAPLAERLGMGEVKRQLDDLAFPYLYPKEYRKVRLKSSSEYKRAENHIRKMKRKLLKTLAAEGLKVKIDGREKGFYSLWRKLERPGIDWDFEKIYDIVALRVFTNSISECYLVLGVLHQLYKPVPHQSISDYIAVPKPNGYQSIHSKVFGPGEKVVEVQIRTHQMHEQAEYGAASHVAYAALKESGVSDAFLERKGTTSSLSNKLSWVKELVRWQKEIVDSEKFMEVIKFDALSHRNFIFSPKGDVYDLPAGATPVDFACAVHTDLINYIKAAKVDGRIVQLSHPLKSGDVVEIVKTKSPKKPNRGWLEFVKTHAAKRKIKGAYKMTG